MEVISQDLKFSKPRRRFMGFASKEGAGEGEPMVKVRENKGERK
jgi:hypothetical protein